MKSKRGRAFPPGVIAGIAIGILAGVTGSRLLHAQTKAGPGYLIAEVEVTDSARMQEYGSKVAATLAPFHHEYLVRGSKIQSLEGQPPEGGIVVIAFDSIEKAREWYDSPAYAAIRPIRQSAAKSRIYLVEGVPR